MKNALVLAICTTLLVGACGGEDPTENFLGTFQTTLTVSGTSSVTFADTLSISEGDTADLILNSQQLGSLKATIIGDTSFALEQQQIRLTDSTGTVFTVTMEGQGTVNDGVLAASGQLSSNTAAFSITINGSRQ